MKRVPLLVTSGAVAGFAGVLAFHVGAASPVAAGPPVKVIRPPGRDTSATPSGPATAGSSTHAAAGPSVPAGRARTAIGPSVNFSYGTIAVRVTVVGTRVTAVSVAALQTLEPTSQQISGQAIPILRHEVLAAHSAAINGVSGATYTSEGYARSLQSALDQLHA